MIMDTCNKLRLKPLKLKRPICLVDAIGNFMTNFGGLFRFLVTQANKESIMMSWSDLKRLVILHQRFSEVICTAEEMKDEEEDPEMKWLNH